MDSFSPTFQVLFRNIKSPKNRENLNFYYFNFTLFLKSREFYQVLLYTLWVFTLETWRVSIADSCTFHLNLTCRNETNHCPRASFQLIHGSRGLQCHYSPLKEIVSKKNDQTISISIRYAPLSYRTGGNRKRSEQSMNADHRSLETVVTIVICRKSGNKRKSKALSLAILDQRSSIVLTFSIASYPMCLFNIGLLNTY